jgi:hypothetical protein
MGRVRVPARVQVQLHWEVRRSIEIEAMWAGARTVERWVIAKWRVVRLLEGPNETCRLEGCTVAQILDREELIDLDVGRPYPGICWYAWVGLARPPIPTLCGIPPKPGFPFPTG